MRRLVQAAAIMIGLVQTAAAQGIIFSSYDEMRQVVDAHMKALEIVDVFQKVLPEGAVPVEDAERSQRVFQASIPNGLENATVFLRNDGENGFKRELLAYWRDNVYVFARVDYHQRENDVVIFAFNIDGALSGLLKDF